MSSLAKRTLFGGVILFYIAAILYLGYEYTGIGVGLLSLIGLYEWNRIDPYGDNKITFIISAMLTISGYIEYYYSKSTTLTLTIGLLLLFFMFLVFDIRVGSLGMTILGLVYISRGFMLLWRIENVLYIILVFLIAFGTDTFAYIVGMTIGKHKLAPVISPNKSIEGAVGGIIGSVLLTFNYLRYFYILKGSVTAAIFVLILASIVSQCGDLFASKIKRQLDIKDYGNLLPGHGGILDRFDSVLFVAPIVYLYVKYF